MEQPPPTFEVNGAAIRKRRKDRGLEMADLAAKVGITRSYLNQLELGHKRHMRVSKYLALRTALDVKPDDTQLLAPQEDPTETR